jgi:hypothetical protein
MMQVIQLSFLSLMTTCCATVDMFPVLDAGATRLKQARASIEA